jgi:hypothetical protein
MDAEATDVISENKKLYENVIIEHNPRLPQMKSAVGVVKEFIRNRGLIIYGGTAIDYALRLKGDFIYPDESLTVPDLDFYSPTHIEDTYDLVEILFKLNYKDVNAHRALYMLAMRIDIGGNNIVADLGYLPPDVFNHIPTLDYEGMKIMHPHYQMIDIHSSLSFPYDEAASMRESLFNRWKKDVVRYNKMLAHYPIPQPKTVLAPTKIAFDASMTQCVFAGYAGYALLYVCLAQLLQTAEMKMPKGIITAEFNVSNNVCEITTVGNLLQFVHMDIAEFARTYLPNTHVDEYNPYKDIIPRHYRAEYNTSAPAPTPTSTPTPTIDLRVYSTENRLIGVSSVRVNGKKYRCVNINHVMMFMMIYHHVVEGAQSETAAAYYLSCLKMIEVAELAVATIHKKTKSVPALTTTATATTTTLTIAEKLPFFPSIHTYGGANYSDAIEYKKLKIDAQIDNVVVPPNPIHYEPSTGKKRPTFDYTASKYFARDGAKIVV